ncbi:hypothetical protein [Streptomyces muensis]|uniref:Uncharacterized protein n=1 Tax=Streptomyces muensis TaxID=1077944 RepID=A0A9X1Q6T5_STRM4|nr:hypothetical protein [Streptomyces muensis]MCF1598296.1 hypothetical protein [Streptomyces muensis]
MIERRLVTQALGALLATATGKPCGAGALPQVDGKPAEPPYSVLRSLTLTLDGAPFTDRHEDSDTYYQVDCVARTHAQAEWLADRVRTAVLGRDTDGAWLHALTVPGFSCYARELALDAGPEDDPAAVIVSYVIRFQLRWTPATG